MSYCWRFCFRDLSYGMDACMKAVLLSGGIDSIALAHWKRPDIAITIDYGQKAARTEIAVASTISSELNMAHETIQIDCSSLGSGDMAGQEAIEAAPVSEWWPFRNQLLITFAGMRALSVGVTEIMTGTVASDESHKDGRLAFYDAIDGVMRFQEGNIRVSAPAIALSTTELVKASKIPRNLLSWAHSCHVSDYACGACRGCVKHYQVMDEIYGVAY